MKLEIPEHKKLVHEMVIPVRWGDMDAMGHVNNTVYFRYLEVVRIEWLERLRTGRPDEGQGPVVANAFCNFIEQVEWPADLLARMYVGTAGRSSLDTWYTLARADAPEAVVANGGATMVWVDRAARRSAPLPDWLRQAIA